MSKLQGQVGSWKLKWLEAPRGNKGTAQVEINGKVERISWVRDDLGLWISREDVVHGFEIEKVKNDDESIGYDLNRRNHHHSWKNLKFVRAEDLVASAAASGKKKAVKIKSQMPGKIVKILVKAGDTVEKNQPVIVMEAMKMENEIRSPAMGVVGAVQVTVGQAVESGMELMKLDES